LLLSPPKAQAAPSFFFPIPCSGVANSVSRRIGFVSFFSPVPRRFFAGYTGFFLFLASLGLPYLFFHPPFPHKKCRIAMDSSKYFLVLFALPPPPPLAIFLPGFFRFVNPQY